MIYNHNGPIPVIHVSYGWIHHILRELFITECTLFVLFFSFHHVVLLSFAANSFQLSYADASLSEYFSFRPLVEFQKTLKMKMCSRHQFSSKQVSLLPPFQQILTDTLLTNLIGQTRNYTEIALFHLT